MRVIASRQEAETRPAPRVGKAALTALTYVARAGLMAASFYGFIAAADIIRDVRVLEGALPIESWRDPFTQREFLTGIPVWGFGLGVTGFADYLGKRELEKEGEFTPFESFTNRHAGALATGAWTGLFATMAVGTLAGAMVI